MCTLAMHNPMYLIFLNKSYDFPIPEGESINSGFGPATGYIYVQDSSTPKKVRLGGRLY